MEKSSGQSLGSPLSTLYVSVEKLKAYEKTEISESSLPTIEAALSQIQSSAHHLTGDEELLFDAIGIIQTLKEKVDASKATPSQSQQVKAPKKRRKASRSKKTRQTTTPAPAPKKHWHGRLALNLQASAEALIKRLKLDSTEVSSQNQVLLAFISDIDSRDHNGSQLGSFLQCVQDDLIVVSTRSLISCVNIEGDETYRKKREQVEEVLYHETDQRTLFTYGEYVVVVPTSYLRIEGVSSEKILEQLGFKSSLLVPTSPREVLGGPLKPAKFDDFQNLFNDIPVERFMLTTGHGGRNGMVAGMSKRNFAQFLKHGSKKGLRALVARSCYAGGPNRMHYLGSEETLRGRQHKPSLPFPVVLCSIDEVSSHLPTGWRPAHFLESMRVFATTDRDIEQILDERDDPRGWDFSNCMQISSGHPADAAGGFRPIRRSDKEIVITNRSEAQRHLANQPNLFNADRMSDKSKGKEREKTSESIPHASPTPIRVQDADSLKLQCLEIRSELEFSAPFPTLISLIPGNTHHFFKSFTLHQASIHKLLSKLSRLYQDGPIQKVLMIDHLKTIDAKREHSVHGVVANLRTKHSPGFVFFEKGETKNSYYISRESDQLLPISQERYLFEAFTLLRASRPSEASARLGGPLGEGADLWRHKFKELCETCAQGVEDKTAGAISELPKLLKTNADRKKAEENVEIHKGTDKAAYWQNRLKQLSKKQRGLESRLFANVTDHSALLSIALAMDLPDLALKVLSKSPQSLELERVDLLGNTPLLHAALNGRPWIVEHLLKRQADPTVSTPDGITPLMYAVKSGNNKTVEAICIALGGNLDQTDKEGQTALMWAYNNNRLPIFELLLSAGADLTRTNKKGRTLVTQQAAAGDAEKVSYLLDRRPDLVRAGLVSPLNVAIRRNNAAMCKLLIEKHKASVTAKDGTGKTPLETAIEYASIDLFVDLFNKGKGLDEKTLASLLSVAVKNGSLEKVEHLLKAKANPNLLQGSSNSPLRLAIIRRDTEMVELLLRHKTTVPVDMLQDIISLNDTKTLMFFLEHKLVDLQTMEKEEREAAYLYAESCAPDLCPALRAAGLTV